MYKHHYFITLGALYLTTIALAVAAVVFWSYISLEKKTARQDSITYWRAVKAKMASEPSIRENK